MKTMLTVEIEYDPAMTDPDGLACAMDRLLETALSTPDIFSDYGNPKVGEFFVAQPTQSLRLTDFRGTPHYYGYARCTYWQPGGRVRGLRTVQDLRPCGSLDG